MEISYVQRIFVCFIFILSFAFRIVLKLILGTLCFYFQYRRETCSLELMKNPPEKILVKKAYHFVFLVIFGSHSYFNIFKQERR